MKSSIFLSAIIIFAGCKKSPEIHPGTGIIRMQVLDYYSGSPLDSVEVDCYNNHLTAPDSTIYPGSDGYFFVGTIYLSALQLRKNNWWSPLYTFGGITGLNNFNHHDTLFMYKPRTGLVTVVFDSIMDYPYTDGFLLSNNLKLDGPYPGAPTQTASFKYNPLTPTTLYYTIDFIDSIENELVFGLEKGNGVYETTIDTLFYPEEMDSLSFVFHY